MKIAQKLLPFSQQAGIKCLVPGSCHAVEVFPALLRIYDLSFPEISLIREERFVIEGPLKNFFVVCDIERGCVTVTTEQYRYHVLPDGSVVHGKNLKATIDPRKERLCLGSHKKQRWEDIKGRLDFIEIFPFWHALGEQVRGEAPFETRGVFALADDVEKTIKKNAPEHILNSFKRLFLASFEGIFIPRSKDTDHQGILKENIDADILPLPLLKRSRELIRSLFIEVEGNKISLLPNLPPEFFSGRFLNVLTPFGKIDFEWSKKRLRQMVFRSTTSGELMFDFGSNLKSYRLRKESERMGRRLLCASVFEAEEGVKYTLDRFEA